MAKRPLIGWTLRSAAPFVAALALAGPACTSEVPRSDPEPQAQTSEGLVGKCPPGYYATDCNPETFCSGVPPHCIIRNVCTCVPDPFPIPFPQMPTGGGAVLPKLRLVTIAFAGDTQGDNSLTDPQAAAFGDFIVNSQWLQTVTADYRPNPTANPFVATHLAHVTLPGVPSAVVDVPTLLKQNFGSSVPLPADRTGLLYQVFLPQTACDGSSRHNTFTYADSPIVWAQVCGNAVFTAGNRGPSHEVIEAITDPYMNAYTFGPAWTPWLFQGEVGDACEGIAAAEAGYAPTLATVWSNGAAAAGGSPCIPAPPAYYNVSPLTPLGWDQWDTTPVTVQVGHTVNVTLGGWSVGAPPAATWDVSVAQNGGYALQVSLIGPPGTYAGEVSLSASTTITLQITAPAATTPHGVGSWVNVQSWFPGSGGNYGVWPIEISVP